MKRFTLRNITTLFSILLLMIGSAATAQEGHPEHRHPHFEKILDNLTPEQKTMLEERRNAMKAHRKTLKATMNEAQLAIAKDSTINKREKRELLRETFTDAQIEMIRTHKEQMRPMRKAFRETLTEEQKATLKEHLGPRMKKRRHNKMRE